MFAPVRPRELWRTESRGDDALDGRPTLRMVRPLRVLSPLPSGEVQRAKRSHRDDAWKGSPTLQRAHPLRLLPSTRSGDVLIRRAGRRGGRTVSATQSSSDGQGRATHPLGPLAIAARRFRILGGCCRPRKLYTADADRESSTCGLSPCTWCLWSAEASEIARTLPSVPPAASKAEQAGNPGQASASSEKPKRAGTLVSNPVSATAVGMALWSPPNAAVAWGLERAGGPGPPSARSEEPNRSDALDRSASLEPPPSELAPRVASPLSREPERTPSLELTSRRAETLDRAEIVRSNDLPGLAVSTAEMSAPTPAAAQKLERPSPPLLPAPEPRAASFAACALASPRVRPAPSPASWGSGSTRCTLPDSDAGRRRPTSRLPPRRWRI